MASSDRLDVSKKIFGVTDTESGVPVKLWMFSVEGEDGLTFREAVMQYGMMGGRFNFERESVMVFAGNGCVEVDPRTGEYV